MSRRQRATRDTVVLRLLAELDKPDPDEEVLMLLRTEARELMVDADLDMACQTCLEPLEATVRCTWCGSL